MASHITDPKDFARHINEHMLAEFLAIQNPPIAFEVTTTETKEKKKRRVDQDTVDRFIKTVEELSDKKVADYLFTEMIYINTLSGERHITNLEQEAFEKRVSYDLASYSKCECNDERALWWYIHHKDIFDSYFERADTENLAGLKEVTLKDEHIVTSDVITEEAKLGAFGNGVAKIFESALRGKKFKVSHFCEKDCVLVRVYLENLPDNQLVFSDTAGGQIERTPSIRSLFSVVVVYNPAEKTLGVRSVNPSVTVPKLIDLFCKTFLNCEYADTTERKYNVEDRGSIKKLELTPELTEERIEKCYLKAVEYMRKGDTSKTLRLDIGGKQTYSGTEAMEDFVASSGITEDEWIPKRFEIKFIFRRVLHDKGRKRQITAGLTKRGVNLKNTPEDQAIRQFLKNKGFVS
jgi:hypothetical protein